MNINWFYVFERVHISNKLPEVCSMKIVLTHQRYENLYNTALYFGTYLLRFEGTVGRRWVITIPNCIRQSEPIL